MQKLEEGKEYKIETLKRLRMADLIPFMRISSSNDSYIMITTN